MTQQPAAVSKPGRTEHALGLSIASHSGLAAPAVGAVAAAAEAAGYSAVFVAEGHGDALSLCHPVVAATSRVRVGTAIANAALRPPVLAAKTAAQLDQASGGRFLLGLGVGNAVMNGRFGLQPFPPLQMIEEYVGAVRAALAGHPAGFDGRLFRTGMVPFDSPPVRAELPVYLAALGPRMLGLAGRIADGVVLNLMSPAQAGLAASLVRAAAVAAGREASSVEVACVVHTCMSDDPDAAAAAARAVVPRYVLHPAATKLFGADLRAAREPRCLATGRAQPSAFPLRSLRRSSRTGMLPRAPPDWPSTARPASTSRSCSRCQSAATGAMTASSPRSVPMPSAPRRPLPGRPSPAASRQPSALAWAHWASCCMCGP
jgi:5,10-methylenetetrahydromethanopterin reductase